MMAFRLAGLDGADAAPRFPPLPIFEAQQDELALRIGSLSRKHSFMPGDMIGFKHGLRMQMESVEHAWAFVKWMDDASLWDNEVKTAFTKLSLPGGFLEPDCYIAALDKTTSGISLMPVSSQTIEPFDPAKHRPPRGNAETAALAPVEPPA